MTSVCCYVFATRCPVLTVDTILPGVRLCTGAYTTGFGCPNTVRERFVPEREVLIAGQVGEVRVEGGGLFGLG